MGRSGVDLEVLAPVHPLVPLARELERCDARPREEVEEGLDESRVVGEIRGGLPDDRPERGTEREDSRGEEVGESLTRVAEPLEMRHEPRPLDGEHELVGNRLAPASP